MSMSEQLKAAREKSRLSSHESDESHGASIPNSIEKFTGAVDEGFNGAFDAGLDFVTEAGSNVNGFAGNFAWIFHLPFSFVGFRHRPRSPSRSLIHNL
jgi:hypothetical protein